MEYVQRNSARSPGFHRRPARATGRSHSTSVRIRCRPSVRARWWSTIAVSEGIPAGSRDMPVHNQLQQPGLRDPGGTGTVTIAGVGMSVERAEQRRVDRGHVAPRR